MPILNIMYFAIGFLAAGLLALMIMPSVWHRAVRLTKTRIEAATPMTLNEFRADKDQLRAEFALSTRRLEKNVDTLRTRLADQLTDINQKKTDLAQLKVERDQHLTIVQELESREGGLRHRILEVERESTDYSQRLRMRDRDYSEKVAELDEVRSGSLSAAHPGGVDDLIHELEVERRRANYFETQSNDLLNELESAQSTTMETSVAAAEMRKALAEKDDQATQAGSDLLDAEARIASAEDRLNNLLSDTQSSVLDEETRTEQLLAEKLSLEDELAQLRNKIGSVENSVMQDWEQERLEQSHLRERLNDIASDVSRLIYAVDGEHSATEEPVSLFDRVTKYAGSGIDAEPLEPRTNGAARNGDLSDRMAALRDMQIR